MKTARILLGMLLLGGAASALAFDLGGVMKDASKKVATDPNKQEELAKGATGLTVQEEIDIGDAISVEIVARYGGIWRDVEATRRANLVGKTLTHYARRGDLDWRFGILNSDAVNAFSAPNGRVFITKGLYQLLGSDDELAAVLAHEIAHVDLRHAAKIIAGKQGFGAGVGLLAESTGDELGADRLGLSEMAKVVEDGVAKAVAGVMTDGYGANREYLADREACELATNCGFDPNGLRSALTKVEANTAHTKETFNTHPKTSDRLKKLPGGEEKKKKGK